MKIITSHINLDFDGFASSCLLKLYFKDYGIVFPGSKENKVNSYVKKNSDWLPEELSLKEVREKEIKEAVIADTSSCKRLGELCRKIKNAEIYLFDHHFTDHNAIKVKEENLFLKKRGSTSTIVVEFLKEKGVEIPAKFATLGVIGIYEDTDFLSFAETTPYDAEAVAYLLKCGADLTEVSRVLKTPLNKEQVELLNKIIPAIEKIKVKGREISIVQLSLNSYYSDVSTVIHRVMELEAIDLFIAIIQMEKKVYLMVKSNFTDIDLKKLFGKTKGGHKNVISIVYKDKTVFEVRSLVEKILKKIPPLHKCGDIASPPITVLKEHQTVKEVFEIFNRVKVNSLPLADTNGNFIGYVLRQDIDYAISKNLHSIPVENFANREVFIVDENDDVETAKKIFLETGVKLLFVKSKKGETKIITRTSALKYTSLVKEIGTKQTLNLKSRLRENLPEKIYSILETVSFIAKKLDVEVYIVGGFVRDLLLKKKNYDLDFVVSKGGMEFGKKLAEELSARVKVHDKFDTAVVILPDGLRLDVATLRFEYYDMPGDLPRITPGNLFHDLYRRDFTINAMAICLNIQRFGELIDYFNGRRDLKDRIIRVLHSLSFIDDPTRVLRALRFKHRYKFRIGKTTESLMLSASKLNIFSTISGSRFLKEFSLLFAEKNASFIFNDFEKYGCVKFFGKNIELDHYVKSLALNIDSVVVWYGLLYKKPAENWLLYLMAMLIHANKEDREKIAKKLSLKRREKEIILNYKAFLREYSYFAKSERKFSELYHFFKYREIEELLFALAFFDDENYKKNISLYIDKYIDFKLHVGGNDAIALGMKEGREIKEVLDKVISDAIDMNVTTKEGQLKLLEKHARDFLG